MGGVGLFDLDHRQVSVDYRQDFLVSAMAEKSIRIVWPTTKTGSWAVDYSHHGNLDYHEQQAAACYALQATHWLIIGVEGRYLQLGTSDTRYQPQQWLAAAVRMHISPSHTTTIDLIAGTRPWDQSHPYRLHLQTTYRPSTQWLTVVEVESEDRLRMRMGMEYLHADFLALRAGLATHPMTFTCGIGLRYQSLSFDLCIGSHPALGLTPQTSLTLWF